ncbi:hypothetical protein JCM3775_000663 [Rhodotorula graminis]
MVEVGANLAEHETGCAWARLRIQELSYKLAHVEQQLELALAREQGEDKQDGAQPGAEPAAAQKEAAADEEESPRERKRARLLGGLVGVKAESDDDGVLERDERGPARTEHRVLATTQVAGAEAGQGAQSLARDDGQLVVPSSTEPSPN